MTLRIRIEKYLEHAWTVHKGAQNSGNLAILCMLTEQLRNELNCAIFMPHLEVHPLFEYLSIVHHISMQRIATKALSRKLLARNETIFQPDEIAQHMTFPVSGRLLYERTFGAFSDREMVDKDGDWVTEP